MNPKPHFSTPAIFFLSLLFFAACGDSGDGSPTDGGNLPDGGDPTSPTVVSNTPLNGATDVPINGSIRATFSEAMDPATLTTTTFTVTAEGLPVEGTVVYAGVQAVYQPTAHLAINTDFTATITTEATSAAGVPMESSHSWSFTTGETVAPVLPVSLGTADDFAILAKAAISTVPTSDITGDVGLSPAAATFITGFSLTLDSSNAFSTSPQVTGEVFAADYAAPTPSKLTTAVGDMERAFTDAAGRAPGVTELGAGDIGGMTLDPGVYQWSSGLLIPTDVTLTGSSTDVWIFQVAGNLTLSNGTSVLLAGGALPENVFWQVAGEAELGTTAHGEGIILSQTAINLRTGASINGRLLAQTSVGLDGSTVVEPTP